MKLGDFEVEEIPGSVSLSGETTKGVRATGVATTYLVRGPRGTALTVADVRWENGERDIRTLDRHVSPQSLDRLKQGLRLGIQPHGSLLLVELRQARLKEGGWSNLFRASWSELDAGAGVDVRASLLALGATAADRREVLLGDHSARRSYLCALFPQESALVPIAAYVLTRIAPIVRGVRA